MVIPDGQVAFSWRHAPGLWAYPNDSTLGFVERWTHDWRLDRKRKHDSDAQALRERAVAPGLGLSPGERLGVLESARWHDGRARGQEYRFWDLRNCGGGYLEVRCKACCKSYTRKLGCSNARLCVACRDARAGQRRAKVWRARAVVAEHYKLAGVLSRYHPGGRWSEKDFTLTLPDAHQDLAGDDAVERRIGVLFAAWTFFVAHLNAYLREEPVTPQLPPGEALSQWPSALVRNQSLAGQSLVALRAAWHRGFEWTPGHDGKGHPHFHVWYWGPWLPGADHDDELRHWWADALRRAGVDVQAAELIHAHVREVKSRWIVKEVIKGKDKYTQRRMKLIAKRADADGSHHFSYVEGWHVDFRGKRTHAGQPEQIADAMVQARVFACLEGKRTVQASVGFLGLGDQLCACPACQAIIIQVPGGWEPVLEPTITNWRAARERGPPVEAGPTVRKAADDVGDRHAEELDLGDTG